ncbi:MAG: bifunctional 5,10-methylenetetrahydrofolate dehydrogenase/5,10-methenyltetrahydrofolate cyclohydrolase [Planctomycetota bacterium]|nr:bifunctional 5,10-methylenetetrahydrofolate dehydrogenase/5,10-methenyltetrahydrofolate cyclohydrolase [Planctomycetota bacterium]
MADQTAATLLKGAPLASKICAEIQRAIDSSAVTPCLVNVVVGDNQASNAYLGAIDKIAHKVGVRSERRQLPAVADQARIHAAVSEASGDQSVHGVMIQFPLPKNIDQHRVVACLSPAKDVDGITDENLGTVLAGKKCHSAPATAAAVVELLAAHEQTAPAGKDIVIIGRSLVVGKPLAAMLSASGTDGDATVTLCHTKTKDLSEKTRVADIVIVAAGSHHLLKKDMVKQGAIVIDVGIHAIQDSSGRRLEGDVNPAVGEVASALSPVPGGVGPVTNAILMRHVTTVACPGYLSPAW